ncbi:MAG: HIT family protein [Cyclobacteriaceae bacterium]|nr:HIT family protein [Cyclobacteriaceae bacterium HetDA_MAG_MS6]
MASIFSRIVTREIPAHIIGEDESYLAFLDINPLREGHTLVIPKQEVDYIFHLEDELLSGLHVFAKKVAKAIEEVIDCERIGMTVIGLEVPHAHVHLIPINGVDDMDFGQMKLSLSSEELADIAKKIKAEYDQLCK